MSLSGFAPTIQAPRLPCGFPPGMKKRRLGEWAALGTGETPVPLTLKQRLFMLGGAPMGMGNCAGMTLSASKTWPPPIFRGLRPALWLHVRPMDPGIHRPLDSKGYQKGTTGFHEFMPPSVVMNVAPTEVLRCVQSLSSFHRCEQPARGFTFTLTLSHVREGEGISIVSQALNDGCLPGT